MGTDLSGNDKRIWELHGQGFAPSQIAGIAGTSEEAARAVIAGVWADDKLAARNAKRSRAA